MSDFIPEDVVVDILSRLPTKSLIRFRSVSKLWYALITSPSFINTHLNQSIISKNSYENLPLVIVRGCTRNSPPETVRLEHYKLGERAGLVIFTEKAEDKTFREIQQIQYPLELEGYAKGLFCFLEDQDKFFLWNPSIKRFISLPPPGIAEKTYSCLSGFGFDSRSNDYKVVRVVRLSYRFEEVPVVQVYSLNVGSWKVSSRAGNSFPLGIRLLYTGYPPACLDGAIHFAAQHRGNPSPKLICSFDLGNDVFKTMSLPNDLANPRTEIRTVVFRGLLSLLCNGYLVLGDTFCSIWIMKEYGVVDSWYKYVRVDLTGGIVSIMGIQNNGHILLQKANFQHPRELYLYDPQNKEIKKLGINASMYRFHVDIDVENLILLNKTDDGGSKRGTDSSLFSRRGWLRALGWIFVSLVSVKTFMVRGNNDYSSLFSRRGWLRALGWIFESLVSVKAFMLGGNNDFRSVTAIVGLTISEILVPSLLLCHFLG